MNDQQAGTRQVQGPFLSVVIPVYNVEKYLPDLFGSLRALEGRSVELIFVEDCSTDGSVAHLTGFAQDSPLDIRIVRHDTNQGLSAARNSGLAVARGEYVWFVDSDDMINPAGLDDMFRHLEVEQPDVLVFDFVNFSDGLVIDTSSGAPVLVEAAVTLACHPRTTPVSRVLTRPHRLMAQALRDLRLHAWSYCFRRSLLPAAPFPVGRVYEDMATIPLLLHAAERAYYHPAALILYRNRPDSISKRVTAKRDLDLAFAMRRDWQHVAANPATFSAAEINAYLAAWLKTLLWSFTNLHNSGLLEDEAIFREYRNNWSAYRRAAGWRHPAAIRRLPRPTMAALSAALALTVSPRVARIAMRRVRPLTGTAEAVPLH